MAGSAKSIQTNRGGMVVAELRGSLQNPQCKKFQILFFYLLIVGYNRQEETASKKNRITNQGWFIRPRQAYLRKC
jgi:hypothetical protein